MPSRRITFPLSFGAMQMSDICCLLNVRVSSCLSLRIMFREQQIAKETLLLLGCNTFERYFINGEWNRQRGQKLTLYCSGDTLDGTEHATWAAQLHRPAFRMHANDAVADCNCGLRASYTIRTEKTDRRVWRYVLFFSLTLLNFIYYKKLKSLIF